MTKSKTPVLDAFVRRKQKEKADKPHDPARLAIKGTSPLRHLKEFDTPPARKIPSNVVAFRKKRRSKSAKNR